ncbi:hypothetical protein ID866_3799 [Astraeus odoratus]|nr:hypothetical protein ID866_3799 [Astraeus odoratus]
MRLTFSKDDYLNTRMYDDHERTLYVISTTGLLNTATTISKVNGPCGNPETLAIIRWSPFTGDNLWFRGREISVRDLLVKRPFSTCVALRNRWTEASELCERLTTGN